MTGPLIGAVLCGGRSSRFGRDKALADVNGDAMALHVANALRDVGADPVVAVGGDAGIQIGLPTVPDRSPGLGPLGGLASILRWAKTGLVLVAPCDLPLLSVDHLVGLAAAATPDQAAVASIDGRPQPSLACWPASWGLEIQSRLDAGKRAWREALTVGPWVGVPVPPEAMADADTEAELSSLLETGTIGFAGPEPEIGGHSPSTSPLQADQPPDSV